jgi:hypothetical protein
MQKSLQNIPQLICGNRRIIFPEFRTFKVRNSCIYMIYCNSLIFKLFTILIRGFSLCGYSFNASTTTTIINGRNRPSSNITFWILLIRVSCKFSYAVPSYTSLHNLLSCSSVSFSLLFHFLQFLIPYRNIYNNIFNVISCFNSSTELSSLTISCSQDDLTLR